MTRLPELVSRVIAPFRPAPGTTEGAVSLGLVGLGIAFWTAGMVPLAIGVPSGLLLAIALGFSFRWRR